MHRIVQSVTRAIATIHEAIKMPRLTIHMSGDTKSRAAYDIFTMPHPRYRIIKNKSWGVAMMRLPDNFDSYLKQNKALKRNRANAIKLGYTTMRTDPHEHLDEIIQINASMEFRHGRRMPQEYLDINCLRKFYQDVPTILTAVDSKGEVRAYMHGIPCGEFFLPVRLLGHGADLESGIMYLLVSELIRELISLKLESGLPRWVGYDTIFGGDAGGRYFKERLGFKPYKVTWVWDSAD